MRQTCGRLRDTLVTLGRAKTHLVYNKFPALCKSGKEIIFFSILRALETSACLSRMLKESL